MNFQVDLTKWILFSSFRIMWFFQVRVSKIKTLMATPSSKLGIRDTCIYFCNCWKKKYQQNSFKNVIKQTPHVNRVIYARRHWLSYVGIMSHLLFMWNIKLFYIYQFIKIWPSSWEIYQGHWKVPDQSIEQNAFGRKLISTFRLWWRSQFQAWLGEYGFLGNTWPCPYI